MKSSMVEYLKNSHITVVFLVFALVAESITAIIVSVMSTVFHGSVGSDFLITGAIAAFVATMGVTSVTYFLLNALRESDRIAAAEAQRARAQEQLRKSEEQVREYVGRLERAVLGAVGAVSQMMDIRDPYTAGHERRVGEISAALAAEMGLDADVQRGLRVAGAVHDVGKINVPAEFLAKPGNMSPQEFAIIQTHAQQGYEVLKDIDFPWPVAEIARQHHERIDGSGYPRGLKGDEILLEARILAVADVVEAMASHRPYREGLGIDAAIAEIERGRGTAYDANAADACMRLFREKGYTIPA